MTPLFACFPVCLTFVGLGVLALLVLLTGVFAADDQTKAVEGDNVIDSEPDTGIPPWWLVVLIFSIVPLVALLLAWLVPEWD